MLSLASGTELRRFRRGTLPKLAVVVMLGIPLLYGALYLWAFWSPTDHVDALPVALVDADEGATVDGTTLRSGADLAAELTGSDALDWHEVDADRAAAGVRDGEYYFAVTIPSDFSAALASAGGDDPQQARLEVTYDDANSFLATTLGRSALQQIRDAVATTAGTRAVDQVLVGLGEARDGFAQASDGAVRLRDGATSLLDGTRQLAAGAGDADSGAQAVADGAARTAEAATRLASGADDLRDGTASLDAGTQQLAQGTDQAATAARTLAQGTGQLADGVHAAVTGVDPLVEALPGLADGLDDVGAYLAAQAAAGDAQAATLLGGLQQAADRLPGQDDLAALHDRLDALDTGAAAAATGARQLDEGIGTLATSAHRAADGAAGLADGAQRLADGAAALATGTGTLRTGAADLATGTRALATGAQQAADGAAQLQDGSTTLATSLADGAARIPADDDALRQTRAAAVADPVTLDDTDLAPVDGLGEGFAPLFLPLALFVGGIITWLLLRALPSRALATPAAGWRVAMAGYLPAALLGVGQVAVLLGVVVWALGLRPENPVGTVAFLVLVAAAFLALQQMLVAVLGSAAGRVATIALLMLQLTSAGGTYPVETTPAFFRALHPYLPMTYAVQGLRDLITGTPDARLWTAVAVLVGTLVGALAVTSWKAARMRTWTVGRLHPALSI